jgi:ABC-2 type transport system permease protein
MSTHAAVRGGRRGHGPSAVGDDLRRFWSLTITLATTEFKLRFFGSALGYVWTLMRPLMLFGILYFVFTRVVRVGDSVPHYPVYLLMSIVMITYFNEATGGCVSCLVNRESLLRKIRFPRMVIPLSVSLTSLFNLGMNLFAVFVFALANGVHPKWTWLELPFLIALLVVLATGVGMLLSALFVRYRDIAPIWEVTAQILWYGSPVLYTYTFWPPEFQRILLANPLAMILTQAGHALIGGPKLPNMWVAIGGAPRLLIPLGIVALVFALGLWVFNREAPRIAENL